LKWQRLIS